MGYGKKNKPIVIEQPSLTEVNEKLAQKASKEEVDTAIINIGSASPKGTYGTLTDLQNAFPTGTTGIYVVTGDGKWYYWNGSAWAAGGQYQSTGIADGSVTPKQTNFASTILTSVNMLNKLASIEGYSLNASDGSLYASSSVSTSEFMECKPDTTYTSNGNTRIVEYDANKNFVKGVTTQTTITTGSTGKYIRMTYATVDKDTKMFVEGTTLPLTYQSYSDKTKIDKLFLDENEVKSSLFTENVLKKELKVTEDNATFIEQIPKANLLNKATSIEGYSISASDGSLYASSSVSTSDFIEVNPSTNYTSNHAARLAEYDANKVFIQAVSATAITTGVNGKYLRAAYSTANKDIMMVVEGNYLPAEYVPYGFNLKVRDLVIADTVKKFEGKTWNVLGDSITSPAYAYWSLLAEKLGISKVNNYGEGGTSVTPREAPWDVNAMSIRYVNMDDNADLITVFGGTNDNEGSLSMPPLGTMTDRDPYASFYGACHTLFSGLINKYPTKTIAVFTFPPRQAVYVDGYANTHPQRAKIIKEVAEYYAIPCLDIFHSCRIKPYNQTSLDTYMPDGLHPNEEGHKLLAEQMLPFLESL